MGAGHLTHWHLSYKQHFMGHLCLENKIQVLKIMRAVPTQWFFYQDRKALDGANTFWLDQSNASMVVVSVVLHQ